MSFTRHHFFCRNKVDTFQVKSIHNELAEFKIAYFFNGKRIGRSGDIELFVVTYLIDIEYNLFLRYCIYTGHKRKWKNQIKQQLENLMSDIGISREIINSQLRYFEVDNNKYLDVNSFEQKYLELKSKLDRD